MAGYNGYSMSNNAVSAYINGEKPLSKWTKQELLCALGEKERLCKKLTTNELRSEFLKKSSWHHTSSMYNRTDFYRINVDAVEEITAERVEEIIECREKPAVAKAEKPMYITALVEYDEWEGTRKHPRKVRYRAIVKYMSTDKMVKVNLFTTKRLSSLWIVNKIEQKTKFADAATLRKKFKLSEI